MDDHAVTSLRGVANPPPGRPNRTWVAGRVCGCPGCGTRLSIYNRSSLCWQHEPLRTYVVRGSRRRATYADRPTNRTRR